jgi:ABC-2 type transport system ATP-binding protein
MIAAIDTNGLGKRYGRNWALRDCTLAIPNGRVSALVGPNGAGKTTLLQLSVGLVRPTTGTVAVYGDAPVADAHRVLPRIGFVAQDKPLYRSFTVEEMLHLGARLNPRWDDSAARARLRTLGIPLNKQVGKLSGGQRSQVALVLALGKRPDLLLLDEPIAELDPLARREFLQLVLEVVAEEGLTVLLSSHIIGDLERVCDYLVILSNAQVQLTGEIDHIVAKHRLLVGPRTDDAAVAHVHNVVQATHSARQTSLLVRTNGHVWDPSWQILDVPLEEIILAYLGQPGGDAYIQQIEEVPA